MRRDLEWIARALGGALTMPAGDQDPSGYLVDLETVSTDSRECVPGSLYLARQGESADGHRYIPAALANGAAAVVVERVQEGLGVPQILVEDSTLALGRLARKHLAELRKGQSLTVVGVTGSAGKTTTKDLLARAGTTSGPTVAPKLSFNNEVGCPLTILKADEDTRYLVLEMGASGAGHINYLTDIAPLDIAVVLMVGRAHLGGFGSEKALAEAKAELVEGLLPGGVAVLNRDDPLVWDMRHKAPGTVIGFSAQGDLDAGFKAEKLSLDSSGRPQFTLATATENIPVQMRLVGLHQVVNALAALAAGSAMGLDLYRSVHAVESATPDSPHRMAVHQFAIDAVRAEGDGESGADPKSEPTFTLIDDSYNANPDSMKAAFAAAQEMASPGARILMVLGEMLELGDESEQIHREVGDHALAVSPALLIQLGEGALYVEADPDTPTKVVSVQGPSQAHRILVKNLREGDVVLIKGSNGSQSWKVADLLVEAGSVDDLEDAE